MHRVYMLVRTYMLLDTCIVILTKGTMTFGITTLSIMAISKITFTIIIRKYDTQHSNTQQDDT